MGAPRPHEDDSSGGLLGTRLSTTMVAVAVLVALALSLFTARIYTELKSLRATSRDNVQWSMAQLEVEYLVFQDAVHEAYEGDMTLSTLRERFDIFYSRVALIATSDVFATLTRPPENRNSLQAIRDWLDGTVPLIDGPDAALGAALGELDAEAQGLRRPIRQLSLEGVRLFAEASDARRAAFSDLLYQTASIAAVLILLLGLLLVLLLRQNRISTARAEQLRLSAQRFEQTVNGSLNAIVVADEAGTVVEFNPGAERTFGYARDAALGGNIADLIVPPRHKAAHAAGIARLHATGAGNIIGKGRVEIEALHADGHEFPVELALARTSGPDGVRIVAYMRDITQRLETERELIEARDKALGAARAKSHFLAVMSHEMRTPLNGVLAVLDLLAETALDPRQREYVETATASGEILQHHIDDVLDVTRIEAGRLTFQPRPFDLAALIEEIARINRPPAEARSNTITVETDLPDRLVLADRHRIGQILLNLIGNAVKFTEGGRIAVSARRDGGEGMVEIAVTDDGIGMSEADLDRIFDDFVMLDPSYRRKAAGSGLGLSICRRIALAMNGEIRVESEVARGSRFTLRLPLEFVENVHPALRPDDAGHAAEQADERVLEVLLVEDNETNRFAAREMLRRERCVVSEAEDGLIGLSLSEQQRFDLILMDISMPRLDGIEATRAIRTGCGASARVPIVGLTAHALPEEQERLRQAGMHACLTKPLRVRALRVLLARVRAGELAQAPALPVAALAPPPVVAAAVAGPLDAGIVDELRDTLEPGDFVTLVGKYRGELLAVIAALGGSGEDLAAIRPLAHRAAGAAALVGADELKHLFATLEDVCRDGEAELIAPVMDALHALIPPVLEALDRLADDGRLRDHPAAAPARGQRRQGRPSVAGDV